MRVRASLVLNGGKVPPENERNQRLATLSSLANLTFGASSGVGLQRGYQNDFFNIFMKFKNSLCLRTYFKTTAPNRGSFYSTDVIELHKIYRSVDATIISGTWANYETSGSGVSSSAISCRTRQSASSGAILEFNVSGDGNTPYDVKVAFSGKTLGAYCIPFIDGAQTLIAQEIVDPGSIGFRAFSTKTSTDNVRANIITIARNLTGSHVVRLQQRSNPAGGAYLNLEAVAINSTLGASGTTPPDFQANTAYSKGDEVFYQGCYYRANATGTSGSSGPTHRTGVAFDGDGVLAWFASTETTYFYPFLRSLTSASEAEYFMKASINNGSFTGIGGQMHGNDTLISRSIKLDGSTWSETGSFALVMGEKIEMSEESHFQNPNKANFANASVKRIIKGGAMHLDAYITLNSSANISDFYPGMMEVLKNDGKGEIFTQALFTKHSAFNLASYTANSANFEAANSLASVYKGSVSNIPIAIGVAVSMNSVKNYANIGASAFIRPNVGAAASGYWQSKTYLQRVDTLHPEPVYAGQKITISSTYAFGV